MVNVFFFFFNSHFHSVLILNEKQVEVVIPDENIQFFVMSRATEFMTYLTVCTLLI